MKNLDKKILFSVFGNMFEWYDYTLYIAFVPIFTKLFFSFASGQVLRSAVAFGVFAAGYLARPIGGLLFGYIGDFKGREVALRTSVWSMTISAAAIGFLPTVQQIGTLAPWLLILIRICQGISVGGEFTSSSAYLIEISPKGRSSFYSSFVMFSLAIGIIMGSLMFLIINRLFGTEEVLKWAWRLPFLFSLFLGYILMHLRSSTQPESIDHEAKTNQAYAAEQSSQHKTNENKLKEGSSKQDNNTVIKKPNRFSILMQLLVINELNKNNKGTTAAKNINNSNTEGGPSGEDSSNKNNKNPPKADGGNSNIAIKSTHNSNLTGTPSTAFRRILQDMANNKVNALVSFCVALGDGVPFYILCVAFPSILGSFVGYSNTHVSVISIVIMLSYGVAALASGLLSDKFGSKKVMSVSALMVAAVPFATFLSLESNNVIFVYFISCLTGLVIGLYHGSLPSFLLASFPSSSRATIVSLTYNIGITIFGATAPMFCFLILGGRFAVSTATTYISAMVSLSAIIAFFSILARKTPEQEV